jgi:hypothetical protein
MSAFFMPGARFRRMNRYFLGHAGVHGLRRLGPSSLVASATGFKEGASG